MLDYTRHFFENYDSVGKFAVLTFLNAHTANPSMGLACAERIILDWFQDFLIERLAKDTILIFQGDHGSKFVCLFVSYFYQYTLLISSEI